MEGEAAPELMAHTLCLTTVSCPMQNGYTVIGTDASGTASTATNTAAGALYTLNPNGAFYSPYVSAATCVGRLPPP